MNIVRTMITLAACVVAVSPFAGWSDDGLEVPVGPTRDADGAADDWQPSSETSVPVYVGEWISQPPNLEALDGRKLRNIEANSSHIDLYDGHYFASVAPFKTRNGKDGDWVLYRIAVEQRMHNGSRSLIQYWLPLKYVSQKALASKAQDLVSWDALTNTVTFDLGNSVFKGRLRISHYETVETPTTPVLTRIQPPRGGAAWLSVPEGFEPFVPPLNRRVSYSTPETEILEGSYVVCAGPHRYREAAKDDFAYYSVKVYKVTGPKTRREMIEMKIPLDFVSQERLTWPAEKVTSVDAATKTITFDLGNGRFVCQMQDTKK